MVIRIELIECLGNVAGPVGVRPREVIDRVLLVGVEKSLQVHAVVAHISHVEERVLGQLPLRAEEPAFDIAIRRVFRNPGDIVRGRVEGGNQAGREALIGSGVTRLRCGADRDDLRRQRSRTVVGRCRFQVVLVYRGELGLGSVDAENIARSGACVVNVPGAEPAAKNRLGGELPSESNARRKVAQRGIHERLPVDAASG